MLKGMLMLFLQRLSSKRRAVLFSFILIAMLSGLVQCVKHAKHKPSDSVPILYQGTRLVVPEHSALRSVVHVESVHRQAVVTTVVIPTTVQAIPANTVAILPPLTGQIDKIFKTLGEPVRVGDPLYSLISPDLAQAISDRTIAEANYALAQKNIKRQQALARYEINSLRELEQAERDLAQTDAELQRSNARLAALHINPADHDTQGHLLVRSPINGVMTAISGGVGTYWSDLTAPVVSVADLSRVYLVASAQERDLPDFFLGQDAQIIFESLHQSYWSRVAFIDPVLDVSTRTIHVGMILSNVNNELRPNMFARAKFKRKARQEILLPMTAVIQRGFDSIVFVEVAPWQFEPRVVKVGLQMDDKIEITSGLADQERVAMTGGIILND